MSLPRLLLGIGPGPMALDEHHHRHGQLPPTAHGLLDEIAGSGLRGRGGAAFPLSIKLKAVRRGRRAPVLVVNGCEGEPMSAKDRVLLSRLPHLVLDGAFAIAREIGAKRIVIAVEELNLRAIDTIHWALTERGQTRRDGPSAEIVTIPGGYVSGQESAIARYLNQGVAAPGPRTPLVTERGVASRPTLVSNAETLAHVALIARHGARWFREVGTSDDPGSALVTVTGAVARPGVYEIAHGSSLAAVIGDAGGLTERCRAFLVGGYAGGWIDITEVRGVRLSRAGLAPFGARLGPGMILALPERSCPAAETARVARWLAEHSSGQCGPCVNGLASIADELSAICQGTADPEAVDTVARWCDQVVGRGACAHPDGATAFISSALRVFADELDDHARNGLCDACHGHATLPTPGPALAAH